MKIDVQNLVRQCTECQQNRSPSHTTGLLQPLRIPIGRFTDISMSYVVALPQTRQEHDATFVTVDRMTKLAHFVSTSTTITAAETVQLFRKDYVRLRETPLHLVTDRDLPIY